jgi:hypothetical protein
MAAAGALLGFGDLDEVTRNGDRQTLAVAQDVLPAVLDGAIALLLPELFRDALWRFEAKSLLAPLAWLGGGVLVAGWLLRRQRVA